MKNELLLFYYKKLVISFVSVHAIHELVDSFGLLSSYHTAIDIRAVHTRRPLDVARRLAA